MFFVWEHGEDSLKQFIETRNPFDSTIKFTAEWSREEINFLDVNIRLRGSSYGGELARLSGLARLGEMIFIPCSHGIFYLSSIKKFMSLEKDCLIKCFLQ